MGQISIYFSLKAKPFNKRHWKLVGLNSIGSKIFMPLKSNYLTLISYISQSQPMLVILMIRR
jgi:hypothetical protein